MSFTIFTVASSPGAVAGTNTALPSSRPTPLPSLERLSMVSRAKVFFKPGTKSPPFSHSLRP